MTDNFVDKQVQNVQLKRGKQEKIFSSMIIASAKGFVYVLPIESRTTGLGIPDLFMNLVDYDPFPVWCELKDMGDIPTVIGAKIDFEPGQYNRLLELYRAGSLAFVQIYNKGSAMCIPLDLIDRETQRIKEDFKALINNYTFECFGLLKSNKCVIGYGRWLEGTISALRIRQYQLL